MPAVNSVLVAGGGLAGDTGTAIHLARAERRRRTCRDQARRRRLGSGITLQGNALRELKALGVWDDVQAATTRSTRPASGRRTRTAPSSPRSRTPRPAASTCPPHGHAAAGAGQILIDRATEVGVKVRFGTTFTELAQDDAGAT